MQGAAGISCMLEWPHGDDSYDRDKEGGQRAQVQLTSYGPIWIINGPREGEEGVRDREDM